MDQVRIRKEEFLDYAPSRPGSIRINHNAGQCSGDSKSLLITRKDDESVTAYCFRCGGTGFHHPQRHFNVPRPTASAPDSIHDEATGIYLPADSTKVFASFPKDARDWLSKAGITSVMSETAGLCWSDETQMLYIPVTQETSAFGPIAVGFVQRLFQPKRYLTLTKDRERFYGFLRASEELPEAQQKTLVIVEDMISALRCREICDTLALCGTELRPHALSLLIKEGYTRAVVFLDGDNTTVQMKARKIAKRLSWMKTSIVETGSDPKSYTKEQLGRMIHEQASES